MKNHMTVEERQKVKQVILEVMEKDESFIQEIIQEIIEEKLIEQETEREQKIRQLIKEDFQKFKKTFEALS